MKSPHRNGLRRSYLEPSDLGSVGKNGNKNQAGTMLAPGSTLVPGL